MKELLFVEVLQEQQKLQLFIVEYEVFFICWWWDQESVHSFGLYCFLIGQKDSFSHDCSPQHLPASGLEQPIAHLYIF